MCRTCFSVSWQERISHTPKHWSMPSIAYMKITMTPGFNSHLYPLHTSYLSPLNYAYLDSWLYFAYFIYQIHMSIGMCFVFRSWLLHNYSVTTQCPFNYIKQMFPLGTPGGRYCYCNYWQYVFLVRVSLDSSSRTSRVRSIVYTLERQGW